MGIMKIRIRIADPAGNITIFVLSRADRKDYPYISRQLLAVEELKGEQVGFVEQHNGAFHMQMMGGEFCANASRSFASLLAMGEIRERTEEETGKSVEEYSGENSGEDARDGAGENTGHENGSLELEISVSGASRPLKAWVDIGAGTSRVEMPLPEAIGCITLGEETFAMVTFDGICHILVPGKPRKEAFIWEAVEKAKEACPCGAWGIMFLQNRQMIPVVYVEETGSMVWEGSCGSGTTAAAVWLFRNKKDGEYTCILEQPGGKMEARVKMEGGRAVACSVGGPVSLSREMEIEIEERRLT